MIENNISKEEADYIEVTSMYDLNNIYQPQFVRTGFETSVPIPESKFPLIKKAIEQAINSQPQSKDVEEAAEKAAKEEFPDSQFSDSDTWNRKCFANGFKKAIQWYAS